MYLLYLSGFSHMLYGALMHHYPGDAWIVEGWLALKGPIGDLNADGGSTFGYGGLLWLNITGYGDFIFQSMFAAKQLRLSFLEQLLKELNLDLSWYMRQFLLALATLLQVHGIGVEDGSSLNGEAGFKDFAGSTVVHAFGGFAALACVLVLGARKEENILQADRLSQFLDIVCL